MTLATAGWAVMWVTLLVGKFAPAVAPSLFTAWWAAAVFASVGLFLAVFTIRARLIWVLLAGVPLFANASLLLTRPLIPVVMESIDQLREAE